MPGQNPTQKDMGIRPGAPGDEPKLTETEIILLGLFFLTLDALDWAEVGVPITDAIAFPVSQIYLRIKGVPSGKMLGGNLLELIPLADYLPMRTAAFLWTAWIDRHPTAGGILKAAEKMQGEVSGTLPKEINPGPSPVPQTPQSVPGPYGETETPAFSHALPLETRGAIRDVRENIPQGRRIAAPGQPEKESAPGTLDIPEEDKDLFAVKAPEEMGFAKKEEEDAGVVPEKKPEQKKDDSAEEDLEERLGYGSAQIRRVAEGKDVLEKMSGKDIRKDEKDLPKPA